jgi:Zn-dependent protease
LNILSLLPENLIFLLPSLLLAITVHEFAHAWVSHRLGDPTPRYNQRITLNPLAHIDPLGMITLLLFGFGWGKAVEINPSYYRNQRQGMLLVSVAGPVSNVVTAFVLMLGFVALLTMNPLLQGSFAAQLLSTAFSINIVLAVFNMLPVPPLDGSKVLASLLPRKYSYHFQSMAQQWGFFILIALMATGLIGSILRPLTNALLNGMLQVIIVLVGLVM